MSLPAPPIKVSLPAPPSKVLFPELPVILLSKELPVALVLSLLVPVRPKFSILSERVKDTEE